MPSLPYCGCSEYTGSSEKSPRRFSDDLLLKTFIAETSQLLKNQL